MKRLILRYAIVGCLALMGTAFAGESRLDFTGTWQGTYCTMNSKEGLMCGKSIDLIITEQKNDMVRGHLNVSGKSFSLSGTVNADNAIDYIDSLGTIGVLMLTPENIIHMKALNRCVAGNAECSHSGTFKKKNK